ncbi:beta-lactamase family protein [Microcoleus sp. FACHB-SPT15]|nr:beta-lactamase family protein [Microcoleus sp. FACHB-SPT15]
MQLGIRNKKEFMKKRTYNPIKKICLVIIGIILFFSLSGFPYLAQGAPTETSQLPFLSPQKPKPTESKPIAPPRPTRQGPSNPQEVEAFLDKFFTQEMQTEHVPGAVVALVKDGEILFSKGYGYADVEKKIPVVPDKTLFRVASISKLFTGTAVMQLYERGLLDLNKDINQYLKHFQIENPYPKPITLANLMTQTDGSSQRLFGIAARTAGEMVPLKEFIPDHMPPIVWQPGELYSYSNMGVTLAGYLVELISGVPFVEYINENILQPLNMRRSTFLQPLPPNLASDLAVGYQYQDDHWQSRPFLYLNIAPAASLSATATDMAHFMIAHLQNGRYENSRILNEETAQLMHRQQFTHHPKLPGITYSFHERLENNIRTIGHLGSLRGYSSSLTLLPDQNVGLFVGCNSFNGIHEKLSNQFINHYYPVQEKPVPPKSLPNFATQAERFTGVYRGVEYPHGSLASLGAPLGHLQVKANRDGTLTVQTPDLFFPERFIKTQLIPVEPLLFQRTDDDAYTAFGEDTQGNINYLFNPVGSRICAFRKIAWYETIPFQLSLAGFCAVVFLSVGITWLIRSLSHRFRKRRFQDDRLTRLAWLVAGLVGVLNLVFLIGLPIVTWRIGIWQLLYGVPVVMIALLCIPPVTTGMTLGLPTFAVVAWKNKNWSIVERVYYSLIAIASLAFIPFLVYWNLLGFQF